MRNTAQGIRNPPKIGPESRLHSQSLEYSTWNPESVAWNPESKTLDFLQLCRSCPEGLSWLVAENNDMSLFKLFQYCSKKGLGTTVDFFSEQLLHDPFPYMGRWIQYPTKNDVKVMFTWQATRKLPIESWVITYVIRWSWKRGKKNGERQHWYWIISASGCFSLQL